MAFLPFPTSVFSEHAPPSAAATVLYSLTLCAISLLQLLTWIHAVRGGLLIKGIDPNFIKRETTRLSALPVMALLGGILGGAITPWLAYLCWFLIFPVNLVVSRILARRYPQTSPEVEVAA